MSTTTQDQTTVLALADIQAHIQDQQAQLQAQLSEARKELEDQQVRRATVQKTMTEKRHELGQWQTHLSHVELDVKRASADLEHSRGTTLEQGKLDALASAQDALGKAKHESAQLVTSLESDALAERNFTEQIEALAARIEHLSRNAGELVATHERFSAEQIAAIKALGEEAVADVQAERERLREKAAQADSYYDQAVSQFGLKLAALSERAALDFMAAHIRVDGDPPGVVAAQAELARAQEEAGRPRVSFGDAAMAPTIVSLHTQVDVLHARIETLRNAHREHLAHTLLTKLRQPAPALVVEASGEAAPLVVEVARDADVEVAAPRVEQESHQLVSGMHSFGLGVIGAVPKPHSALKEKS